MLMLLRKYLGVDFDEIWGGAGEIVNMYCVVRMVRA